MKIRIISGSLLLGAFMWLSPIYSADGPSFEKVLTKPMDEMSISKDGSVITIKSKTGIGGAGITLTEGQWPKVVTLKLQLSDGTPLKGLESIKLATEQFKVDGSLKSSGRMIHYEANKEGEFVRKGHVEVTAKQTKEALEVTLPADMLKDVKKLEIQWVDFFR